MMRSAVLETFVRLGMVPSAAIILCERTGKWASAWRQLVPLEPGAERWQVVETRSPALCRDEVANEASPPIETAVPDGLASLAQAFGLPVNERKRGAQRRAVVIVEWSVAPPEKVAALLIDLERLGPTICSVVVADPQEQAWELPAREAGAAAFMTAPWQFPSLFHLARRHLQGESMHRPSLED